MLVTDDLLISPIQRKMLALFSDGKRHTPQELHTCLSDELGSLHNITAHITYLRKALRPRGRDISFQRVNGKPYYQLVDTSA